MKKEMIRKHITSSYEKMTIPAQYCLAYYNVDNGSQI